MLDRSEKVVVLGTSPKPERYSNQAIRLLREHGYSVIPIHPKFKEIEGIPVVSHLKEVREKVHTVTLYVGPENLQPLLNNLVSLRPQRVILNPGTEADFIEKTLTREGIPHLRACTLVLLKTGQF